MFRLNPISFRGSDLKHVDESFSVARSSAGRVFCSATSFSLSALFFKVLARSAVTSCCADLIRQSSGNSCTCDTICSKRGAVTLTDEVLSRLASLEGFAMPNLPKRTGRACTSLSDWPYCRSVMAGMRVRDIALSSGSS